LNGFAVIMVLFDYLVAPQLLFRGIEGVFKSVRRRELKFLDEMDASLYDSGVAAKAEAAENAGQEEKDGVGFWNLLDTFLESYPGIKSSSTSRDLTDRNSLSSNDKKLEIIVDFAGIVSTQEHRSWMIKERKWRDGEENERG
jgi:hypothetical protein